MVGCVLGPTGEDWQVVHGLRFGASWGGLAGGCELRIGYQLERFGKLLWAASWDQLSCIEFFNREQNIYFSTSRNYHQQDTFPPKNHCCRLLKVLQQ